MVWKEINIESWQDIVEYFESMKLNRMVYRGQSNSGYKLESSFRRELTLLESQRRNGENTELMLIRLEDHLIELFKSQYHLYLDSKDYYEGDDLYFLSILQHYGAPTRLLDWSFSPFISTYFAISNNFQTDSALYALDLEYIVESNRKKIEDYYELRKIDSKGRKNVNPIEFGKFYADSKARAIKQKEQFNEEIIIVGYEPERKNIRLARQQGLFLVSSKIDVNFDEVISSYGISKGDAKTKENVAIKFIINKNIKMDIMKSLQLMNISNEMLFPEMEGFCKSLKYKLLNDNYYNIIKGEK